MTTKQILSTLGILALIAYLYWAYKNSAFPFGNNSVDGKMGGKPMEVPSEITITSDPATIYSRVTIRYDANGNIITDPNKTSTKSVNIVINSRRTANAGTVYPTNGIEFIINKEGLTYQYYSIGEVGTDYILKDEAKVTKTKMLAI